MHLHPLGRDRPDAVFKVEFGPDGKARLVGTDGGVNGEAQSIAANGRRSIGTWMTRVATSWLVYRLTKSALLLGTVGFAGQIPSLLLAPMAGVTNPPFRTLCRRFGAGLYVSEMITARPLVEGNEKTLKLFTGRAHPELADWQTTLTAALALDPPHISAYGLTVEAGTGTGKSLAYLLPAISWSLLNRERVVVSTHMCVM